MKLENPYNCIVLNVPHSSIEKWNEGWNGVYALWRHVKEMTDWHTDLLFCSEMAKMHRFPFSRFHVDVERLINDDLEKEGQGILYTKYGGLRRELTETDRHNLMLLRESYMRELEQDLKEGTILIDCHSFPSHISNDVDVNIGFNNDWSKPPVDVLNGISEIFSRVGYKVEWNKPYSNSITPSFGNYHSIMIELNKKTYMDEDTLMPYADLYKGIGRCINNTYDFLLGQ